MSQIGEAQHARAIALALMNTTALNTAMVAVAQAKDEFTGAPIKLALAMLSELPEETIDGLPRIGSEAKETDNPDIFKWKDPSSDAKEKDVSFYVVWSDNTPEGAKTVTELGWLSCLSDDDKKRDHISAEFIEKYGTNPEARKQRKKYLEGRRGTIRASYKKAVQLIHQMDAINSLAGCNVTTIPGAIEGTYENVLLVKSTVPGRETLDWEHFTVGALLKLKAGKAAEQGGTLAALKATVARDGGKKKVEAGIPALASIQTPETMDKVMTAVHSYLDGVMNGNDKRVEYGNLLKFLTAPGGGSAVETLGDMKGLLDQLFRMDKISFIYAKVKEADAENVAA